MITKQMLVEAIAECQGERQPNANTCYKLAAYFILLRELFGEEKPPETSVMSSYDPPPQIENRVTIDSDSEFAKKIQGMESGKAWKVIDEFVTAVWTVNPSLYNHLIRRLSE